MRTDDRITATSLPLFGATPFSDCIVLFEELGPLEANDASDASGNPKEALDQSAGQID